MAGPASHLGSVALPCRIWWRWPCPVGPAFVDALRRVWDDGDAVLPVDPRLPPPARAALLAAMAPSRLIDEQGEHGLERRPPGRGRRRARRWPPAARPGAPKGVVLTHDAVAASARATSATAGGQADGDAWLACLPLSHVGGLSVVTRALVTGTPLTVLPGFDATAGRAAAAAGATLVSLVPTALRRIDPTLVPGRSCSAAARPPAERPPNVVDHLRPDRDRQRRGLRRAAARRRRGARSPPTARSSCAVRCCCAATATGPIRRTPTAGSPPATSGCLARRRPPASCTAAAATSSSPAARTSGPSRSRPAWPRTRRGRGGRGRRDDDEWGQRVVAFVVPRRRRTTARPGRAPRAG